MHSRRIFGFILSALILTGVVAMSSTTSYAQWNNNNRNNRNWDGYPNWGGSLDLRQTALNAGYNNGMSAGQKDVSRGPRSNFNDFSEYRSASKDYSSKLGDKTLYQRYFRVAFEHGYAELFPNNTANNGNWNGNNGNNNGNNNGSWNNGNWNGGKWTRRGRAWDGYGNYGGSASFRQTALNAGYNEGLKQGRKDRGHNSHNLNDFSSYRNANTDYKSKNGDLGSYQRYFREAFENGYADGWNGY